MVVNLYVGVYFLIELFEDYTVHGIQKQLFQNNN